MSTKTLYKGQLTWPTLKRFPTVADLKEQSKKLFPNSPNMQKKWVEAVIYLRTKSKTPWVADEERPAKPAENIVPFIEKRNERT